jgi:phosphoribosylformylglycinamidine synthase
MTLHFKSAGDIIYLIGESRNDIGSSEYVHKIKNIAFSTAPHFDLEEEYHLQQTVATMIQKKMILSAHDVSEGGLFVTMTESCFYHGLGFDIQTDEALRNDAFLFGEAQSRIVVSVTPDNFEHFETELKKAHQPFKKLGVVTERKIIINKQDWGDIEQWKSDYDLAIENHFAKTN